MIGGSGDELDGGDGHDQYIIQWNSNDESHQEIVITDTDTGSIKLLDAALSNQFNQN